MGSANRKIIFDTNMLLAAEQFRIDVVQEVKKLAGNNAELYITENIKREIDELANEKGSTGKNARIAKEMVNESGMVLLDSGVKDTDTELCDLGQKGYLIATNDAELRKRVKKLGGGSILLRQRKYLIFDREEGGF